MHTTSQKKELSEIKPDTKGNSKNKNNTALINLSLMSLNFVSVMILLKLGKVLRQFHQKQEIFKKKGMRFEFEVKNIKELVRRPT